jgi:hypothetical protein
VIDVQTEVQGDSSPTGSVRQPLVFDRVVVIGGGCYGSWYTQQLAKAIGRNAVTVGEIVVVDRSASCRVGAALADHGYAGAPVRLAVQPWSEYLKSWLDDDSSALQRDAMVPSPLMPHLCLDWLVERARHRWPARTVQVRPLPAIPDVPWERAAPDGRHYVSFAAWTCPVNCIEPAKCPATRGVRDWSMPPFVQAYAAQQGKAISAACIFHCSHRVYGVGMIDAASIIAADTVVSSQSATEAVHVLVGTVSHCHGALGLMSVT